MCLSCCEVPNYLELESPTARGVVLLENAAVVFVGSLFHATGNIIVFTNEQDFLQTQ